MSLHIILLALLALEAPLLGAIMETKDQGAWAPVSEEKFMFVHKAQSATRNINFAVIKTRV